MHHLQLFSFLRSRFSILSCLIIVTFGTVFLFWGCTVVKHPRKMADRPLSNTLEGQLDSLTNQIVSSLTGRSVREIAILKFTDLNGHEIDFSSFVSEELINCFFHTGKFNIIERSKLDQVLAEQYKTVSGIIDEAEASEVGRTLGADAIVVGTITDLGDKVRINARIIDVGKASVLGTAQISASKTVEIYSLMGDYGPGKKKPVYLVDVQCANQEAITFELIHCIRKENALVFDVKITAKHINNSSFIRFLKGSFITDQDSRKYGLAKLVFPDGSTGSLKRNETKKDFLDEGISLLHTFQTVDFPADVYLLSSIKILFSNNIGIHYAAEFKNIPVI